MARKKKTALSSVYVQKFQIPPSEHTTDKLVDSLAEVWNTSNCEDASYDYISSLFLDRKRARIINERIYAYASDERRKLANLLLQFADAIYQGAINEFI